MPTVTELRNEHLLMDRRLLRAQQLTAAVMKTLDGLFQEGERDTRREARKRLIELFHENGFYVVSDSDRAQTDLPPRDIKGWTQQELALYEAQMMTMLLPPSIVIKELRADG